jgi:hypothetical protein
MQHLLIKRVKNTLGIFGQKKAEINSWKKQKNLPEQNVSRTGKCITNKKDNIGKTMKEEITVETTEIEADPLITTKLAYVENLQNEIQGLQEQMVSLQYQMDIRVTALTLYQSSLEVVVEEEPKENGKDLTK